MKSKRTWLGLLAAILTAVILWWQQGDGALTSEEPAPTPSASGAPTEPPATAAESPTGGADLDPASGLPVVTTVELPPEAMDTLQLIASGGPYPYDQDDSVFSNREGILPDQPEGYYREYTVETPGSDDRGARRIVAGTSGEYYWTEDHYASFSRITE